MIELLTTPCFPVACHRFSFLVTHPIDLPAYKGATFHGGFGHGLNCIDSWFRDYFFNPKAEKNGTRGKSLPKPFMLIPPLEEKTRYSPGDRMQCGLILFGEAVDHFMIASAALKNLGQKLGLGRNEGRFVIESIEQITLAGAIPIFQQDNWCAKPLPIDARDILCAHQAEARRVTLHLATRLRLKENNQLVREPPPFPVFFDRLIGRINSLCALYGGGMMITPPEKQSLLRAAEKVSRDGTNTTARWQDWARPAKSGKEEMSFGGLLGEIVYTGDLTPFIPWLALGQWTGVGGKTSFGLGKYQMEITS